ncbi:MAG TPA: carbon storage regulator CsrA [Thermoguttaceae bacterium]|nr:carbon storage regulator CsrA [Thermoguttaceae bacterium]HPP53860.1 carbon storage regulator CsrA [Thermoguttaceae bacterium]
MLVITRRPSESIVIRDDIIVTVVSVRGDKVRLGIEAPKEITVHRKEVYEAIRRSEKPA